MKQSQLDVILACYKGSWMEYFSLSKLLFNSEKIPEKFVVNDVQGGTINFFLK